MLNVKLKACLVISCNLGWPLSSVKETILFVSLSDSRQSSHATMTKKKGFKEDLEDGK